MKAVADDYTPRTMAQLEEQALELLRTCPHPTVGCGWIGRQIFAGAHQRGSAPFARIAGKVMRRLQKRGLVAYGVAHGRSERDDTYGWYATHKQSEK